MPNSAEDLRVLVTLLRRLPGAWSQAKMAERSEVNPTSISLYESGELSPSRATVEKLAGGAGVPPWVVDGLLLPAIALAREIALAAGPTKGDTAPGMERADDESLAAQLGVARFLAVPALAPGEEPEAAEEV